MIYKYLDASRYQGKIDWDAVKRSGNGFHQQELRRRLH